MASNSNDRAVVPANYFDDSGVSLGVLDQLDEDPSWENQAAIIGHIASVQNDAKWAIGEILLFIRYRSSYTPVAMFEWEGGNWPDELFQFIRDTFDTPLNELEALEVVEFLGWNSYRYAGFWILVPLSGAGWIKVWQHGNKAFEMLEPEWENYVRKLGSLISEIMDGNTLLSYYYTAACFPRSKRLLDISWTAHYESTNAAGNEIEGSVRGPERLEAKAPIAQNLLNTMAQDGKVTVARVRSVQRQNAAERRGYEFFVTPPEKLWMRDFESGELLVALDFAENAPPEAIKAILYSTGISKQYARAPMVWGGGLEEATLTLEDGTLVATCPSPDEPTIARALSTLANRMKWKVEV